MQCLEYIGGYLAAHADDELSPAELRDADDHIGQCTACRIRLAREQVLKQMIRRNARSVRTPASLRLRISASLRDHAGALPDLDSPDLHLADLHLTDGERPASRSRGQKVGREASPRGPSHRLRRARILIPLGLTGSLLFLLILFAGHGMRPGIEIAEASVPAFDNAIGKYLQFQQMFEPNVPPEAYNNRDGTVYAWVEERDPIRRIVDDSPDSADISRSYHDVNMPDDLFDFSAAGYRITGGRVDHLPNGSLVTYTMYQGEAGQILSLCFSDPSIAAPAGAVDWLGMRSFYSYKDYSICLTFYPTGHFVSILVTRMPVSQLLREVASTDTMVISRR